MTDVKQGVPMGGTELILANLKAALPELTDQVQIIMSRPEQVELEDKPRILWLQDLPTDPASRRLAEPSYRTNFNRIIFCSAWQQQMYNLFLKIPFDEGIVIKNGVPHMTATLPKPWEGKVKFIYTSTPHRGLSVLGAAAEALAKERQDWELHVYSSLNIYGWHEQDKQFEPLYEQLKANPCVVYHGTQPNAVVREALQDAHVFVYPSIYQETSCMAAQEAMMAGCLAIVSTFGALNETCGEWAVKLPYTEKHERLAYFTYEAMLQACARFQDAETRRLQEALLHSQSVYFQNYWSFEGRLSMWDMVLKQVIAEGPPVEKLILG